MVYRKLMFSPLFVIPLIAYAEEVEEITVSATRQELKTKTVPTQVNILYDKRIKDFSRRDNLRDVLLFDSSLFTLRARGRDLLSIRGFSSERVLTLIDGKRLAGEVGNDFEIDRITLDRVERIEIVKGPASVLYGTDALGGVINIITKEPLNPEFTYSTKYGVFGSGGDPVETNLSISAYTGRIKNFNLGVFARKTEADPYRLENQATISDSRNLVSAGFAAIYYLGNDEKNKVRLDYDYLKHKDTAVTVSTVRGQTQYRNSINDNSRQNMSLGLNLDQQTWRVFLRGYASIYDKDFEQRNRANNQIIQFDIADRRTYVLEGYASADLMEVHRLTVGGEYRKESFEGSRIKSGDFRGVVTRENISQRVYKVSIDYLAAYIQDEWFISDKAFVVAGLRYDDSDKFDSNLSPRVGVTYNISEDLRLKANYSKGFRTPTPRDLYIFFQQPTYWIVGNPGLKSEKTDGIDIGLEKDIYRETGIKFNIFYTKAKDLIDTATVCRGGNAGCQVDGVPVPSGVFLYTYRNVSKAKLAGLELSGYTKPVNWFFGRIGYTYLQAEDEQTDQRLLQRPKHRALLEGQFVPVDKLKLSGLVEHASGILLNNNPKLEKDYTLLYFSGSYRLNRWFELYGGIDNLTDKKDRDLPLLGRFYYAGVRGSF